MLLPASCMDSHLGPYLSTSAGLAACNGGLQNRISPRSQSGERLGSRLQPISTRGAVQGQMREVVVSGFHGRKGTLRRTSDGLFGRRSLNFNISRRGVVKRGLKSLVGPTLANKKIRRSSTLLQCAVVIAPIVGLQLDLSMYGTVWIACVLVVFLMREKTTNALVFLLVVGVLCSLVVLGSTQVISSGEFDDPHTPVDVLEESADNLQDSLDKMVVLLRD